MNARVNVSRVVKRNMFGHKLNARHAFKGVTEIPLYSRPNQKIYDFVDMSRWDSKILDQGAEGDCTAASSGGVWMYLQLLKWRLAGKPFAVADFHKVRDQQPDVGMDFIYALELTHDGSFGQDCGSYGGTAAWILETFGACYSTFWPNTGLGYCKYPSQSAITEASQHTVATYRLLDLNALRTCLSEGYPAWLGCPVYRSWVNNAAAMASGWIPMPSMFERPEGGHEMKVIGYNDTERFLTIDNSWGTDVGVNGRFFMPYDYFNKYVSEAYTARLK